jgi:hypothetical protein
MKSSLVILALAAAVAASFAAVSRPSAAPASSAAATTRPSNVFYGHIKSMKRIGSRYEVRFDPAWFLTGRAAEQAAFEDTGSRSVPNDSYVVEEGHRLLSFPVLRSARVTVLTGVTRSTRVSVAELSQLVNGKNPHHRRGLQPGAAFWLRIGEKYPNPAVTIDQQYHP